MPDNIWDNPADYDALKDGPPYLPKLKTAKLKVSQDRAQLQAVLLENMLKDYAEIKYTELSAVLAYLRALTWLHQTHHWQTNGPLFYGDHLLFDRLYTETNEEIDTVAEKVLGFGPNELVDAIVQADQMGRFLKHIAAMSPLADGLVSSSYCAEECFMTFLQLVYRRLEAKSTLSLGLDNLLQGIADKHEGHLYLLKQRALQQDPAY